MDENIPKMPEQKIRQSASQMWLLATILPLLIGDLVPDDSKFGLFTIFFYVYVA